MTSNSFDREQRILEHLKQYGSASIQEMAHAFGVSNMTIHRNLNKLVETGQVVKKHGGATLPGAGGKAMDEGFSCAMCGKPVSARTVFIVKLENGDEVRACCSHCGLMLQSRSENVWQSLTADYLYGHMISAGQAYYLVGSEVSICCVPSVLAFGSNVDVEKFQKGCGGQVLSMNDTAYYLHGTIHMQKGM